MFIYKQGENERTCNKCGRVHYGITMDEAEKEIENFNEHYNELTVAERERYYGGSNMKTIDAFTQCWQCGNDYTNFRISKDDDCPDGSTLTPIVLT